MRKMIQGFTMIELLVVIAIIGVLATVMLAGFNPVNSLARARDAGRIADLKDISTAMEQYYSDNNEYANIGDSAECADNIGLLSDYINPFPDSSSESYIYRCYRNGDTSFCATVELSARSPQGNCGGCNCANDPCDMTAGTSHYCVLSRQ